MSPFTPAQVAALRSLQELWHAHPFVLIGASALRCHHPSARNTLDLDVTVVASGQDVAAGLRGLGWTRHPRKEHEWRSPDGTKIDVLPVAADQLAAGKLTWAESGMVMSLIGFRHVFTDPHQEQFDATLSVRVARAPVIALLKMVAYLDRPSARQRDLADLALLMQDYVHADDDRRFDVGVLASGLPFDEVPAFLLGQDLAARCDDQERDVVRQFVRKLTTADDPDASRSRFVASGPPRWRQDPTLADATLGALLRGLGAA